MSRSRRIPSRGDFAASVIAEFALLASLQLRGAAAYSRRRPCWRPNNGGADGTKLTSRVLQQRYGVVDRTIDRWVKAGILPKPMRINRIRYWDEEDIQQLERDRMAKEVKPEAA